MKELNVSLLLSVYSFNILEIMSLNLAISVCDACGATVFQLHVFSLSLLKVFWKMHKDSIQLRINHYGNWDLGLEGEDVFSSQFPASCQSQPWLPESKPKYRLWPALRNYICIFINWYKYQTIKEDLIPWIGWQTLGTLASVWQRNNGPLCSKTWINSKPFFMLLQSGVNESTKHAVSLRQGGTGESSFQRTSADLSTVWNTVNTKCCVREDFFLFVLDWHFVDDLKKGSLWALVDLIAACL